jgi:Ca-activated chloride channel homolog
MTRPVGGAGWLSGDGSALPLEQLEVEIDVRRLWAETTVRQRWRNRTTEVADVSYIFAIPERAVVNGLRLSRGNRPFESATLTTLSEAQDLHQMARMAGVSSALGRRSRPELMVLELATLEPGDVVDVEIDMSTLVPVVGREAVLRFPLLVAVRSIPGVPLDGPHPGPGFAVPTRAVPDAASISPPVLLPGTPAPRVSVVARIDPDGLTLVDPRCGPHIEIDWPSDGPLNDRRVHFRRKSDAPVDADFVLRYSFSGAATATAAATHNAARERGTVCVELLPPEIPSEGGRDIVVGVAISPTIADSTVDLASAVAKVILAKLSPIDRFALGVPTASGPVLLDPAFVSPSPEALERSADRLTAIPVADDLAAIIGDILQWLDAAKDVRPHPAVVLLTDGLFGDHARVLQAIARRPGDVSIAVVGIGPAVNAGLSERIAHHGGGVFDLVESKERLLEIGDLRHVVAAPSITEITIETPLGTNLVARSVTHSGPGGFPGVPYTVTAQYAGKRPDRIEVRWRQRGESSSRSLQVAEGPDLIERFWAGGRIFYLEDAIDIHGRSVESLTDLVQFSLAHGLLSRETAFVLLGDDAIELPPAVRRMVQPTFALPGWPPLNVQKLASGRLSAKVRSGEALWRGDANEGQPLRAETSGGGHSLVEPPLPTAGAPYRPFEEPVTDTASREKMSAEDRAALSLLLNRVERSLRRRNRFLGRWMLARRIRRWAIVTDREAGAAIRSLRIAVVKSDGPAIEESLSRLRGFLSGTR